RRGVGGRADVVVDRVAVRDAPRGLRVADAGGIVQHEPRVQAGETGGDELRAAAEAGEEVRLDEAGGDAQVGLDPAGADVHRGAVAVLAGGGETRRGARVVVDDLDPLDELAAEHRLDLLWRV